MAHVVAVVEDLVEVDLDLLRFQQRPQRGLRVPGLLAEPLDDPVRVVVGVNDFRTADLSLGATTPSANVAAGAAVVVEAGLRSGAANTAAWARGLGRVVGAVPGPVTSSASTGCHALLRAGAEVVTRAEDIVEFLEIENIRHQPVGSLGYGLRKRVDLGRALAMEPKVLLMDEPMAGMNTEEKEDLARFILDVREARRIPVVLVEHDMGVVMDLADRIVVLDFGRKIAEGTPREIQENPAVLKAYLGKGNR